MNRHAVGMGAIAAAVMLLATGGLALAADDARYPDLKGQWSRIGPGSYDPAKPPGLRQEPPLTPEYQAVFAANIADQVAGGQGDDPSYKCVPAGMPRAMIVIQPMEIVVTPETTYITLEYFRMRRRIYTDGRSWPENPQPQFMGYSIGKWLDETGAGRFDVLQVETRNIKGPHTYDSSGIPFHQDGQAVVKERIFLDRSDPDILHDEITTFDHALTRPWTVTRSAHRQRDTKKVIWSEYVCSEDNHHVAIGKENYVRSADGHLMPVRKGQLPPDLRYFEPTQK
jgi:hypothetical protein